MTKRQITTCILVSLIFILGLFLRLYRLDQNVPSLYADEAGGQYSYRTQLLDPSISLPQKALRFVQIAPLSYTWLLGLTPLGARLADAINGSLVCLGVFLFALAVSRRLNLKSKFITPILACLLTAVLPWSFMISRIFPHVPLMLFFICLHLYLFIGSRSIKTDLLSLIPLFVGTYFYLSMVVLAPIAVILVLVDIYSRLSSSQRKYFFGLSFVLGTMLFLFFTFKLNIFDPKSRGLDLAIWRDVNVTADSNYYRGIARQSLPTIFSFGKDPETISNKLFFNFPVSVIRVFTKNYLSFFSPDFLFLKGDGVLRHSTGMVGEFFPFLLPFMLYGAFLFFQKADKKIRNIFIFWILFSPVPAAITKDGATYLLRVYTLMPFLTYFCAEGLVSSFNLFRKKWLKIIYGTIILLIGLFSVFYFYFGYFHVYPTTSAAQWEFGFKEVADFQTVSPGKMLIIWDDKYPTGYFCFWQKLPANVCDQNKFNAIAIINGSRVDLPIDNLLFSLPQNEIDLELIIKQFKPAFVAIPGKYTTSFLAFEKNNIPVKTIKYPDQSTAFSIYLVNK